MEINAGVVVSVGVFLVTQALALFKWISNLNKSLETIIVRFEERSVMVTTDLRKVNASLEKLANADWRLTKMEEVSDDHEERIRIIEHDIAGDRSH